MCRVQRSAIGVENTMFSYPAFSWTVTLTVVPVAVAAPSAQAMKRRSTSCW